MKTKTKNLAFLLIIGFVFQLNLTFNFDFGKRHKHRFINPKGSGGYIENFIHVDGSNPKNWTWTAGNNSWCYFDDGYYIIENVTIDASTSPTGSGILIENTKNDYFIIRNCSISKVPNVVGAAAIKLYNTDNGTLIENNCSNNDYIGIYLANQCINNSISNNIVEHNMICGIAFESQCKNNTIAHNKIIDDSLGIYIPGDYNIIFNNTILYNNNEGLSFSGGDNNTISENKLFNNAVGFHIEYSDDNDFIKNEIINSSSIGLEFSNTNNNTISENILSNNQIAIHIEISDDNDFIKNEINCSYIGLEFSNVNNNTFCENILFNNSWGFYIENSDENDVLSNKIINCSNVGIGLYEFTDYNTISNNTLINCSMGMQLDIARNNDITKNLIKESTKGISITNFLNENNTFFQNIFKNNGIHAEDNMNLNDNKWDNGAIGNYWDDYLTMGAGAVDADDNGIGDIPYTNIAGSANSQDNCPIWDDGDNLAPVIIINSPSNSTNHTVAPTFSITITDRSPIDKRWYSVNNGTMWYQNIFFTGTSVTINETLWNSLNNGTVLIRFYANDSIGHMSYKDALINKVPPPPDNDDGDGNGNGDGLKIPGYTIVALISIVSIITIIYKTKRYLNNNHT